MLEKTPMKTSFHEILLRSKEGPIIEEKEFDLSLFKKTQELQKKYDRMQKEDTMYEVMDLDDAELVIAAYGTTARIAKTAIAHLKEEGYKVGLVRPITLFPFPYDSKGN